MSYLLKLKPLLGPFCLKIFRRTERCIPPRLLRWLFYPNSFLRVLRSRKSSAPGWPACLGVGGSTPDTRRNQVESHLITVLELLQDKMASRRWRERCRIVGLNELQTARRAGPVILTFSHFGPYTLLAAWLRAHGIPSTILMTGTAQDRTPLRRYSERHVLFPDVPYVLHLHQLREVVNILGGGGLVLIAFDGPAGKQIHVPVDEQTCFRMATGPLRLAIRYRAEVLPCYVIHEGRWRFRIEFGQRVPRRYLTGQPDFMAAGQHLLADSLPHWRNHPEQCSTYLRECFLPLDPATR